MAAQIMADVTLLMIFNKYPQRNIRKASSRRAVTSVPVPQTADPGALNRAAGLPVFEAEEYVDPSYVSKYASFSCDEPALRRWRCPSAGGSTPSRHRIFLVDYTKQYGP